MQRMSAVRRMHRSFSKGTFPIEDATLLPVRQIFLLPKGRNSLLLREIDCAIEPPVQNQTTCYLRTW